MLFFQCGIVCFGRATFSFEIDHFVLAPARLIAVLFEQYYLVP